MKIILDTFEWVDLEHGGRAHLDSHSPKSEPIAFAGERQADVYYPEHEVIPCESIEDGKAKVNEYLRNAGVLDEGQDGNADLILDLHKINAMLCGDFAVSDLREAVGLAIKKAEGGPGYGEKIT